MTYEMILKAATAEAKFDGVGFAALPRLARERYLARAALGLVAALGLEPKMREPRSNAEWANICDPDVDFD